MGDLFYKHQVTGILSTDDGTIQNGSVPKRKIIPITASGVLPFKEEVLGLALMGKRIFLCNSWISK
jgi:hypothetical protein